MFQHCKNSKKQGDVGLGIAIGYFASLGITVSIPLTDSQDYDLIIDDGTLKRVQVKTTSYKHNGNYAVSLTTKGGNRTGTGKIKKLDKGLVDAVFIVTEDNSWYFIPTSFIDGSGWISLYEKYRPYLVNNGVAARRDAGETVNLTPSG